MNQEKSEPNNVEQETIDVPIKTKTKNQKRVEAGKKGAATRWAKRNAPKNEPLEITKVTKDEPEVAKITKDESTTKPYQDYLIPAGVAVLIAMGIYFISRQPTVKHEPKQVVHQEPVAKKIVDPFD